MTEITKDQIDAMDKCVKFAKWARVEMDAGRLVHTPPQKPMTDAPERIWAWLDQGPEARNNGELEGEWSGKLYAAPNVHEYVRADTITTLDAERDRLRAALQEINPPESVCLNLLWWQKIARAALQSEATK